jgi:hypothetical protein
MRFSASSYLEFGLRATAGLCLDELRFVPTTTLLDMTGLTISEDSGEEFAVRGLNTITNSKDDVIVVYADVTKVHVLPETESFTIQVITPALVVEMDFADADRIREALELFEAKKVVDVNANAPASVRIIPSSLGESKDLSRDL